MWKRYNRAGPTGFEPAIFPVTGERVNQATPQAHYLWNYCRMRFCSGGVLLFLFDFRTYFFALEKAGKIAFAEHIKDNHRNLILH